MLVQDTGRIFGLADEEERERVRRKPGLRAVVEVIKSRMSVSRALFGFLCSDPVRARGLRRGQPTGGWAVMETVRSRFDHLEPRQHG